MSMTPDIAIAGSEDGRLWQSLGGTSGLYWYPSGAVQKVDGNGYPDDPHRTFVVDSLVQAGIAAGTYVAVRTNAAGHPIAVVKTVAGVTPTQANDMDEVAAKSSYNALWLRNGVWTCAGPAWSQVGVVGDYSGRPIQTAFFPSISEARVRSELAAETWVPFARNNGNLIAVKRARTDGLPVIMLPPGSFGAVDSPLG